MVKFIDCITANTIFGYVARIVLTFMFWDSGLSKLIDFSSGMADMSHFGLEPAWLYNLATIIVQLVGSLLVILNRYTWLGAGALAVFTALTIPLAHHFWTMDEPMRTAEFHVVCEHISIIGALMVVSWKSATAKA